MAQEHTELDYEMPDLGDDRVGLDDADDFDADTDGFGGESDDSKDFDDLYDASEDDLDFAVIMYREDGLAVADELPFEVVNDLEELIAQLRRYPGDSGALGLVSIAGEFFVLCRVRGNTVQIMLSDALSACEWPLARDVADFFDEDIDPDDEPEPIGDLDLLEDLGVDELTLEQLCLEEESDADEVALSIVQMLHFSDELRQIVG